MWLLWGCVGTGLVPVTPGDTSTPAEDSAAPGDAPGDSAAEADSGDVGCETAYYPDVDGDGFGEAAAAAVIACAPPPGHTARGGDCADGDPAIFPGSTQQVDGADSDCDGRRDWKVQVWVSVDDAFTWCFDRDEPARGEGSNWTVGYTDEVWLESGPHVFGIQGWDTGRVITAAIAHLQLSDGTAIVSDGTWKYDPNPTASGATRAGWCSPGFDDSSWQSAQVIGPRGVSPWGAAPNPWPEGSSAQWIWDHYPVDLNTQYLRKAFVLP